MKKLVPISATKYSPLEILGSDKADLFLRQFLGRRSCQLYSSGAEALYAAFRVLKKRARGKEVIIPAYTADAVYIAALQAGFRVRFCGMSMKTFNMDLEHLQKLVGPDTAAVVAVHLFGIPEDIFRIREILCSYPVFLIEDAAQALGSFLGGAGAGSMGDISIVSFNKGKNLPALNGGALLSDSPDLDGDPAYSSGNCLGFLREAAAAFRAAAVSLLSRPAVYGMVHGLSSNYRQQPASEKIVPRPMPALNRRLAASLLCRKETVFRPRQTSGEVLRKRLEGIEGVRVPQPLPGTVTVFNRFPVLLNDSGKRCLIKKRLMDKGIESNYYYGRPFYFNRAPVPESAIYFSRHLLTIPSNIFMTSEKINEAAGIFREVCGVSS